MIDNPMLLAAIAGLVNFIKSFGLSGKAATAVSALLGVLGYLGQALLPDATFQLILGGLIAGLAVSGFYDLGKGAVNAYKSR